MTSETAADPDRLMALHVAALFVSDATGRLLCVNDIGQPAAPRFYLGRTPSSVVCRIHADLPSDLAAELIERARDEPPTTELEAPPRHDRIYRELLSPYRQLWSGPALYCERPFELSRGAVAVTRANADLLAGSFDDWLDEVDARQPCYCVLDRGRPVSLCASARVTAEAREAGVETLPDYRGRGHAVAVVSAWAAAVARLGALPLYSTSWENHASQRVAAKCGFTGYGSDYHIT
jgi:RimJ/RimL family protein N-acetyltransferase